jgi:hypothetical protein
MRNRSARGGEREASDLGGNLRVAHRQGFGIAKLDIDRLDARPFGRRAEASAGRRSNARFGTYCAGLLSNFGSAG